MSETCQKLAFTHPIVVLKSELKNNWMKKLDRVNRPLELYDTICWLKLGLHVRFIAYDSTQTCPFISHCLEIYIMT